MICPHCRKSKSDVIWHFGGSTLCKKCADAGFKKMLNHDRPVKDDMIGKYLRDEGLIRDG